MAHALFPGVDVASVPGRSVLFGYPGDPTLIAGVVNDARLVAPQAQTEPGIMYPYSPEVAEGQATYFLRTSQPAAQVLPAVNRLVADIDAELPLFDVGTGGDKVRNLIAGQRVLARLAVLLSVFGLILAAVGLYGVLAYTVTARTHEIGIRAALGADASRLRAAVLRSGFAVTGAGLLIALPSIYLAGRAISSRLYHVSATDPVAISVGVILLFAVASLASWIPAIRATRISPLEALRID